VETVSEEDISTRLDWYKWQAERAVYNVQLLKGCGESGAAEKLEFSSVGRVASHLILNAQDFLVLFVSRSWEQSGTGKLSTLKNDIFKFTNNNGCKKRSSNGIQSRIASKFADGDPEKVIEQASREFDRIESTVTEPNNWEKILTIRLKRLAHYDYKHQINAADRLNEADLVSATDHTIYCISLLDNAWNRSTSVGNVKLPKIDSDKFWNALIDDHVSSDK
jgi:hypothetical protein